MPRYTLKDLLGNVAETVRTLTGRNMPRPTLVILEGPEDRLGQQLELRENVVRLGLDPQRTDLAFYMSGDTSLSGLHARLERLKGTWHITAVSKVGSETFVNNEPLPFHEPRPLSSGDLIRLGYVGQDPVVLKFILDDLSTPTPRPPGK